MIYVRKRKKFQKVVKENINSSCDLKKKNKRCKWANYKKKKKNNKTETDSWTLKTNLRLPEGKCGGEE